MQVSIVSGYFNPLHIGHLRMMQAARGLGDMLVVIVNNDEQQVIKKGRIIVPEDERLEIITALAIVDSAFVAVDRDATVGASLRQIRRDWPDDDLTFCNGGDRSQPDAVAELGTCQSLNIRLCFGVGGEHKADSSSRINAALGR